MADLMIGARRHGTALARPADLGDRRCNFRCVYCMPREAFGQDFAFLPKSEILTFDEITRVARIAVANSVERIRLTGGEPLLRRGIEDLIAQLAQLRTPTGGKVDLALTTNASARQLAQAPITHTTLVEVERWAQEAPEVRAFEPPRFTSRGMLRL